MVLIRKYSNEIEIGSIMGIRIKARKIVSCTQGGALYNEILDFAMWFSYVYYNLRVDAPSGAPCVFLLAGL